MGPAAGIAGGPAAKVMKALSRGWLCSIPQRGSHEPTADIPRLHILAARSVIGVTPGSVVRLSAR